MRERAAVLASQIKTIAGDVGIDIVRFTHADPFEGYLQRKSTRRDPHLTLPGARSLIVFGVYIGGFDLPGWDDPVIGRTSRLFLSGFYSDVVEPLETVRSYLSDQGFSALICDSLEDDSSILPLKLAAVQAGIGWQAKNTLVISPEYGSFFALGGIITDAFFAPDGGPEKDRCGTCRACQEACPTNALAEPHRLNRERCLAYLYQAESLPQEICRLMGNRIVECEICQTVCPWNKKHIEEPLVRERTHRFRERIEDLTERFTLPNLLRLSEQEYEDLIGPYRTDIPYRIFRRNVVIALGNSQRSDAISLLRSAAEDRDPEVRQVARTYVESIEGL
jgi:epoxyqueuosine reductase